MPYLNCDLLTGEGTIKCCCCIEGVVGCDFANRLDTINQDDFGDNRHVTQFAQES